MNYTDSVAHYSRCPEHFFSITGLEGSYLRIKYHSCEFLGSLFKVTSWYGQAFLIIVPLWGYPSVSGGIPSQGSVMSAFDGLFVCCKSEQAVDQAIKLPLIWDASSLYDVTLQTTPFNAKMTRRCCHQLRYAFNRFIFRSPLWQHQS